MRQLPHSIGDVQSLQHRPARWIQTVAAHFLARKFFPLEHQSLQTGHCAKRSTARSGGSAADDCNVKCFDHLLNSVIPSEVEESRCMTLTLISESALARDLITEHNDHVGWSIPIFRIAGIQLRIHITFLLLIAWIAFAYYTQGGSSAAGGGVLFILL